MRCKEFLDEIDSITEKHYDKREFRLLIRLVVDRHVDLNDLKELMVLNPDASLPDLDTKFEIISHTVDRYAKIYDKYAEDGIKALELLFESNHKIYEIADSEYGELMWVIFNRYKESLQELTDHTIEDYGMIVSEDDNYDAIKLIIRDKNSNLISKLIVTAIAFELSFISHNSYSERIERIITGQFDKYINLNYEFTSFNSIGNLIETLGAVTFLGILKYDFLDKNHWPWKDDLLELLDEKLERFNFSADTIRKMQLLHTDTYMGLGLKQLAIAQGIKEYISLDIQGKTRAYWVYNSYKLPNKKSAKVKVNKSIIPSAIQRQLSDKGVVRALVALIIREDYSQTIVDLIEYGDKLRDELRKFKYSKDLNALSSVEISIITRIDKEISIFLDT